jgi:hypothetical protein
MWSSIADIQGILEFEVGVTRRSGLPDYGEDVTNGLFWPRGL